MNTKLGNWNCKANEIKCQNNIVWSQFIKSKHWVIDHHFPSPTKPLIFNSLQTSFDCQIPDIPPPPGNVLCQQAKNSRKWDTETQWSSHVVLKNETNELASRPLTCTSSPFCGQAQLEVLLKTVLSNCRIETCENEFFATGLRIYPSFWEKNSLTVKMEGPIWIPWKEKWFFVDFNLQSWFKVAVSGANSATQFPTRFRYRYRFWAIRTNLLLKGKKNYEKQYRKILKHEINEMDQLDKHNTLSNTNHIVYIEIATSFILG